jgi:Phage tail assembly chaperone protein
MNYTVYNPASGEIIANYTIDDSDQVDVNLFGKSYIVGKFDRANYYIDNNQAVIIPMKPGINFKFNYETKSWQEDIELSKNNARAYRNKLLVDIDKVNPVWYNSLTYDQQEQLIVYRRALLNVPQQAGFPTQVDWPQKPSWL